MPSVNRSLAVACVACLAGCAKTLPPPSFPGHADLHHRAEYAHGAGASTYLARIDRNDGRVAFLMELDGYIALLQDLLAAREQTRRTGVPDKAPANYKEAIDTEVLLLDQEAADVGRLVKEFLDLAVIKRLVEAIPELTEALRLAGKDPPAPNLPLDELRNHQLLLGTGPAACGRNLPDPLKAAKLPDIIVQANKYVDDTDQVEVSPELKRLYARVRSATLAQRKALGLYGAYKAIKAAAPAKAGDKPGETWTFQVGSVDRSSDTGSLGLNHRPRALLAECDFDAGGEFVAARETVLDEQGRPVQLAR